jgi:hypothetical protein
VECCDDEISIGVPGLLNVITLDQDDRAPGAPTCLHIPPTIPNHHALPKIDVPRGGSIDEKSGSRLATCAVILVVVGAHSHVVQR